MGGGKHIRLAEVDDEFKVVKLHEFRSGVNRNSGIEFKTILEWPQFIGPIIRIMGHVVSWNSYHDCYLWFNDCQVWAVQETDHERWSGILWRNKCADVFDHRTSCQLTVPEQRHCSMQLVNFALRLNFVSEGITKRFASSNVSLIYLCSIPEMVHFSNESL